MWTWRYEGVGRELGSAEGRRFVVALFASFAILVGGMVWTMRIGAQANKVHHRLAHSKEALEGLQTVVAAADSTKGRAQ